MNDRVSHYFARGNTARGAHFLYKSAFQGLHTLFVLTGPQGMGKSTILRSLADSLLEQDQSVQCFHSPLRPDDLDGIIATELNVGIVDGRVCEGIAEMEAGEIEYIQLDDALDNSRISADDQFVIDDLRSRLADSYAKAYEAFLTALRIHDEWEQYYIESMDFTKADQIGQELIQQLFKSAEQDAKAPGRHLFFGAATPQGAVDFIQSLTAPLERRIFIKGRPGSGKSTLLKKLAAAAEQRGIEIQVFHCGFDPGSLDMLIFPTLSAAIFDSTAPHEYFPNRNGDEVLDMYALTIAPGTDAAYANELAAIKVRYSAKMKEATSHLASAQTLDSQIRAFYTAATNFSTIETRRLELQSQLNERIARL